MTAITISPMTICPILRSIMPMSLAAGAPHHEGAVDQQGQDQQQERRVDVDFGPDRAFLLAFSHVLP